MTGDKGNEEARKDALDLVAPRMGEEMLEEEKGEDQDEIKEKELIGCKQEIKEEDSWKDGDEAKKSDMKINEKIDSVVNASIEGDTKVPVGAKSDANNEEEEIQKGSANMIVELQSNMFAPDKFIDNVAEVKEKICGRNEHISAGPHGEQQRDLMSVGNGYIKCERDMDDSKEVKMEENTKEVSLFAEQRQTFMFDDPSDGGESGTEEEQSAFIKEVENCYRDKSLEFKAPKFYGEPLNLLKLWRAVIKLGGYDKVTTCKLWRQVGESFNPPKTCTTVSWTFRIFYEKALLEYERHKINGGELDICATLAEPVSMVSSVANSQASGPGRQRRDAAARAMQGWHSQLLLGSGEVSDPIIKDKSSIPLKSREKHLKNIGGHKRKKTRVDAAAKASPSKPVKGLSDAAVIDIGPAADWVKINVRTTIATSILALVPGLLREEVRVQSDPAGRLVISGAPEHSENPWGVTPFKKVVSLPSRIDPHQTSAVVTLHGQLFVRVPFEQSEYLKNVDE